MELLSNWPETDWLWAQEIRKSVKAGLLASFLPLQACGLAWAALREGERVVGLGEADLKEDGSVNGCR